MEHVAGISCGGFLRQSVQEATGRLDLRCGHLKLRFSSTTSQVQVQVLDLSAAFDTIDHNTLLPRLSSWFGITGTVFDWFKSYLSSRPFRVKCESSFSSLHTCFCSVPQGPPVLGPLLFIMYTTPLSWLISSLFLNHHLYADDTQLFFSFHPPDVHSSLTHLHGALQQISSWMTSNLLTLNYAKTEFFFIDSSSNLPNFKISR